MYSYIINRFEGVDIASRYSVNELSKGCEQHFKNVIVLQISISLPPCMILLEMKGSSRFR